LTGELTIPALLPRELSEAWEAYIPEGMESLMSDDPDWVWLAVWIGVAVALLTLAVVSTIGLLLLKRWARSFAFWTTVISVILGPLLGASLYSGLALMLTEAAMLMWGAALAMAYFSEVRAHFES